MDETTNLIAPHVARFRALEIRAKAIGFRLSSGSGFPSGWPWQLPCVEFVIGDSGTEIYEVMDVDYGDYDAYLDGIERILAEIEQRKAKEGHGPE